MFTHKVLFSPPACPVKLWVTAPGLWLWLVADTRNGEIRCTWRPPPRQTQSRRVEQILGGLWGVMECSRLRNSVRNAIGSGDCWKGSLVNKSMTFFRKNVAPAHKGHGQRVLFYKYTYLFYMHLFFETRSHVAKDSFRLTVQGLEFLVLLPLSPECWGDWQAPQCQSCNKLLGYKVMHHFGTVCVCTHYPCPVHPLSCWCPSSLSECGVHIGLNTCTSKFHIWEKPKSLSSPHLFPFQLKQVESL